MACFSPDPLLLQRKRILERAIVLSEHIVIMNQGGNFMELKDYGTNPLVINIEDATKDNKNYRTALWTGKKSSGDPDEY